MAEQIELRNIHKSYGADIRTPVLKGISLAFEKGEMAAVIGQSGSGKTTLLNMIGVLDRPDQGETRYEGRNLYALPERDLARFRALTLGFVFQFHHLLPEFTALENVLLPFRISRNRDSRAAEERARALLSRVGVADRMDNRAMRLSGGQQQRVAIARALMNRPAIILADEPTGNLDSDSGESVLQLLREINREEGTTFILVTHDRHVAARCDRVIELKDGVIREDLKLSGSDPEKAWDRLSPCYCRLRAGDPG